MGEARGGDLETSPGPAGSSRVCRAVARRDFSAELEEFRPQNKGRRDVATRASYRIEQVTKIAQAGEAGSSTASWTPR